MKKFIKLLEKAQLTLGVISLTVFFIAVIIQVFSRYLEVSVIWTGEVANYSFIWAVFMGASVMLSRREHFRFDLFSRKLKGNGKIYLDIVNDIILLVFNTAIFFYGLQAVQNFWYYNWVSLPMISMRYVWISVPLMGMTMAIYTFGHLVDHINKLKVKEGK